MIGSERRPHAIQQVHDWDKVFTALERWWWIARLRVHGKQVKHVGIVATPDGPAAHMLKVRGFFELP